MTDPHARYFGAELNDDSIVPLAGAIVVEYPTRFGDWARTKHPETRNDGKTVAGRPGGNGTIDHWGASRVVRKFSPPQQIPFF